MAPTVPERDSPPLAAEPFRLIDLSMELRLQVYEELLVIGKMFFTSKGFTKDTDARCRDYKAYRKPRLAILRVFKAVHCEAEDVCLARNLFVLPLWFDEDPPFRNRNAQSPRSIFSACAFKKVNHVSIAFSS